ncbi:MAG: hypothetical protein IPJ61_10510 [Tessaracoccus sp.]|uniref:hypothetical protein n=1 Tax=Tessaracoccus sp. TaxID=1971211 RepID=UPI001EBC3391|nr:hypothetical protein [Tessaracoccus sp.]MBK7821482.1 hypothetical protein [Tessaracoccus sp.]
MNFLRTTLSFVLLAIAAALGMGGAAAQWADLAARTPAPARQIVAPVTQDAKVRAALAGALTERAVREIPTIADAVPGLTARLESLIRSAVDASLDDPGIDRAWIAALDSTRAGVVADIETYDGATPPTLWFDLAPFVDLARTQLIAATPERLRPFVDEISWSTELRAPLVRMDPEQTELAASALRWSARWPWLYAGAAILAVGGLVIGPRRGRWAALLTVGLLAAVGLAAANWWAGRIALPSGPGLGPVLVGTLTEGALAHLREWMRPVLYVMLGTAGVGLVGLLFSRPARRR